MKHLDTWKKYLTAQEYAPGTIDLYVRCVEQCMEEIASRHAVTEPEEVTSDMLEDWMTEHPWSANVRKYHYIAIRNFFGYLINKNAISVDPSTILPAVKPNRHIDESVEGTKENRVYSTEDLKAMLEFTTRQKCFAVRDQAIIALMAATGMRASEVCWLTVGQIRRREGNAIFAKRKGQNIRRITIAEFAFPYIFRYLGERRMHHGEIADDAPLFLTKGGKPVSRIDIYNMLAARQKALGLRTGTHNIRYTVINAVERHASPTVARDVAGQKSIAITNNYLVSSQAERDEAVSALPWSDELKLEDPLDRILREALAKN